MEYKIVWFDDDKYHQVKFNAQSDKDAIEISKVHPKVYPGSCFDLYRGSKHLFNEEMWG